MFALASGEPVPVVSTGQMREVDRSMAGYFGIDLARMMENAGRNLADLGQLLFAPRTVIVLAGPGGNGGGGQLDRHVFGSRHGRLPGLRAGRFIQRTGRGGAGCRRRAWRRAPSSEV